LEILNSAIQINIHLRLIMHKIFETIRNIWIKSCLVVSITALMFATNLVVAPPSYAASKPIAEPEVIQPFELTRPGATREEAYDEAAELNKDPKALIRAQNKEEKAQEKLVELEEKEGVVFKR
jgi:hypothetical protein